MASALVPVNNHGVDIPSASSVNTHNMTSFSAQFTTTLRLHQANLCNSCAYMCRHMELHEHAEALATWQSANRSAALTALVKRVLLLPSSSLQNGDPTAVSALPH